MTYQTILIPNIKVQRCNLVHNYLTASCAPVFQTAMFAHGLAASLGCVCGGVGLLLHRAAPHAEKLDGSEKTVFCVSQFRAAAFFGTIGELSDAKKVPTGASLQPSFTGDLEVSVIIQIQGSVRILDIEDQLRRRRIAGGLIVRHRPVVFCDDLDDAYSHVRSGYLVVDKSHLLDGGDVITKYLDVLSEKLTSGRKRSAAGLGYSFLTAPKKTQGSRDGNDHVYAESVSGVVEFVPIKQATEQERASLWLPSYVANDVFVVKQF